jgi:hypothetical protein
MKQHLLLLAALCGMGGYTPTAWAQTGNAYADAVLADTPLVYYRFNEPVGAATASDASGHGNNGSYANVTLGTASINPVLGQAGSFNNQNSSVAVPVLGDQLAQVTEEVWLKPNSMVTFDTIYDEDSWGMGWIHSHLGNGSQIELSLNGNTPTDNWMAGPAYFQNGQWTYVALVYDGTAATLTLYINGQWVDTRTYTSVINATLQAGHIGAWNGTDRAFDGMIDEFAMYDKALTQEQVQAHYLAAMTILVTIQPADFVAFTNSTAGFTVAAETVAANLSYQWQLNGTDIPNATSAAYTTPLLLAANNGDHYQCVLSAGGISVTSRVATLTVVGHEPVAGPIAYLNFENTLADQGGSAIAHDGSFLGNAAFDPTVPNATAGASSLYCLGAGSGVELANGGDLNVNSGVSFSVAAWVKPDFSDNSPHVILAKAPFGASSATHTPALYVNGNGNPVYDVYYVGANVSAAKIPNGEWTHLVVTYDGGNYRFYVNGQPTASTGQYNSGGGANDPADGSWAFTLGTSYNTTYPGGDWAGNIDEVAFWTSALTPAQVLGVFTGGLPKVAVAITQQPSDIVGTVGSTATLTVAGTAVGTVAPLEYQWQKNGAPIAGATNDTYATPALTAADNGAHFSCVVSAGPASAASRDALVTVVDNSSVYPSAVLADTPLVYYRFNEPVGATTAYDSSGHGYNGTYANVTLGTASINSVLGQAGSFNNQNSSVAVPVLGDQLAQLTEEVWLRPNSMATFDTIYDEDSWGTGWVHSHLGDGNRIEFSLNGSNPTDNWMAGPAYFQNGQWSYVALVYDTTASTLTLYVNGQWVDTRTYTSVINATLQAGHIGAWNGTDRAFDGIIDEFALYDHALTPDQIQAHYLAAMTIIITNQPADLVAFTNTTASFIVGARTVATSLTYQWQKNGADLSGATNASYVTPALLAANDGDQFQCVLAGGGISVTSRVATLTVVGHDPVPGPIAYLNFDNTLADQSGSTAPHDGTFLGNATFDPTVPNSTAGTASVNFLGGGSGVALANAADLNVNTGVPFTLACWIEPQFTENNNHVILAKAPAEVSSDTHTPALYVDGNMNLSYDVYYVGANTSTAPLPNGAWTHVVLTYDGASYRFFLNGQPAGSTGQYVAGGGANDPADGSWAFTLGTSQNTSYPGGDWTGNIDEVAFWTSALTPAQVLGVFSGGIPKVAVAITLQPADAAVVAGSTVTLVVAGTAVGTTAPLAYQWQRNGVPIAQATNDSYITPALTVADNGAKYSCVLSAGPATAATREALVTVIDESGTYPATVLADSPLVYYRFDEPVGATTAYDASGHGNHGAYANVTLGLASADAGLGQAGSFNNLNSSVAVPVLGDQLGQFTVEAWLKPHTVGFNCIYDEDGWNTGWVHSHLGNGNQVECSVSGNTPTDQWLGAGSYPIGQWSHFVLVYDSAAATLTLYVNGQLAATAPYTSVINATLQAAHIGAWNGNARPFDGLIDEVAIYDTALTADRVAAHFAAASPLTLSYVRTGTQLTLSWNGTGYKLQQNTDVAQAAAWSDVPGGTSSPVSIAIGPGNRFFRLVKQ